MATVPVIVKILGQKDGSLNAVLGEVKGEVRKISGDLTALGAKGAVGLGAIAGGFGLIGRQALQVAGEFEQFRAQLETVTGSATQASAIFERAVKFAADTPFDVRGIVQATVQLEVYGQRSERILPLVADLAAGMGKRIEDTSLVVGKALSGSAEGFESLRNEFGISTGTLVQYGARLNEAGTGLSLVDANADKARDALERIIQVKFGGAVERQSQTLQGALSNAGDSVSQLLAKFGQDLVPAVTLGARAFSGLVDSVTHMSSTTRVAISAGAVLVTGLTGLASAALAVGSAFVVMAAQLRVAATQEIPGAAAASKVLEAGLGRLGQTAGGLGRVFSFFTTNPIGLALTLAAAAGTSLYLQLQSMETEAKKAGEALADQARGLIETATKWRQYRNAVLEATGAQGLFSQGTTGSSERLKAINEALNSGNPGKILRVFQDAGLAAGKLQEDAGAANKEIKNLIDQRGKLEILRSGLPAGAEVALTGDFQGLDKVIPGAIRKGEVFYATLEQINAAIDANKQSQGELRETLTAAKGAADVIVPYGEALAEIQTQADGAGKKVQFLMRQGDSSSLRDAVSFIDQTLGELNAKAARFKLPTDLQGLQGRLLDPKITTEEKGAVQELLGLYDQKADAEKKLAEEAKRAQKERIDAIRESFAEEQELETDQARGQEALAEQRLTAARGNSQAEAQARRELKATKAQILQQELDDVERFEAEALAAAEGNAQEEKRIRSEVRQRRKQILREQLQDVQQGLADEVASSQAQIEAVKNAEGSTASQVVVQIDRVIARLRAWGEENKALLDQNPELARRFRETLEAQEKARGAEQKRVPGENFELLRQGVEELQQGAVGTEEQLRRVQAAVELVNFARSRGNIDSKKADELEIQLGRQRLQLEQQIATEKLQGTRAIQQLQAQATDEEIQLLEARKAAGEDVEFELKQARAERLKAALDAIDMELQAEILAGKNKEQATQEAQLKKDSILRQEELRLFQAENRKTETVQKAEDERARIREGAANRLGGRNSPFLNPDEAFGAVDEFSGVEQARFGVNALGGSNVAGQRAAGLFAAGRSRAQQEAATGLTLFRPPRPLRPDEIEQRTNPYLPKGERLQLQAQPGNTTTNNATVNINGQPASVDLKQLVPVILKAVEGELRARGLTKGRTTPPPFQRG